MTLLSIVNFIVLILRQKRIKFILNRRKFLDHRVLLCLDIVQFFDIIFIARKQQVRLILYSFNRLDLSKYLHLVLLEVFRRIIKLLLVSYKLIIPSLPNITECFLTKLFMPLIEFRRCLNLLLLLLWLFLFLLVLGLFELLFIIYKRFGFGCLSSRLTLIFL